MTTRQTEESLRETFLTDLTGIFKVSGLRKSFFKKWPTILPIILSVVICATSFILNIDQLSWLKEFRTLMVDFLPGILGFTIAGYSLMVGFIQAGMLDRITEPSKENKFSLYQLMSSAFAINILIQAFALIVAYSVHLIIFIDENKNIKLNFPNWYMLSINYIGLLVLSYWFFISLFMTIQIVINIFSFSQLHHYFVNKAKLDSSEKGAERDK